MSVLNVNDDRFLKATDEESIQAALDAAAEGEAEAATESKEGEE